MRPRLVLDAGILCLLVVGRASRTYIRAHKRLRQNCTEEHFDALQDVINSAREIVVTPHTLAEASNLVRLIGDPARTEATRWLGLLAGSMTERPIESDKGFVREEYLRLGLPDSMLLALGEESSDGRPVTLLTDDVPLYLAALNAGHDAVNFDHVLAQRAIV